MLTNSIVEGVVVNCERTPRINPRFSSTLATIKRLISNFVNMTEKGRKGKRSRRLIIFMVEQ